jgi:hypothetical protein
LLILGLFAFLRLFGLGILLGHTKETLGIQEYLQTILTAENLGLKAG